MRGGNCDTTSPLLGSFVDGTILEVVGEALLGLTLGDGGGQGSLSKCQSTSTHVPSRPYLSVINVANGTDVDVRLGALESGVCAVDVSEASGRLLVQGGLKGARVAILEAAARGPQERRD